MHRTIFSESLQQEVQIRLIGMGFDDQCVRAKNDQGVIRIVCESYRYRE